MIHSFLVQPLLRVFVSTHVGNNPQVSFKGFWDSKITVGIRNVFDEPPPKDWADVTSINNSVHNTEPRFWYIRWMKDW